MARSLEARAQVDAAHGQDNSCKKAKSGKQRHDRQRVRFGFERCDSRKSLNKRGHERPPTMSANQLRRLYRAWSASKACARNTVALQQIKNPTSIAMMPVPAFGQTLSGALFRECFVTP